MTVKFIFSASIAFVPIDNNQDGIIDEVWVLAG